MQIDSVGFMIIISFAFLSPYFLNTYRSFPKWMYTQNTPNLPPLHVIHPPASTLLQQVINKLKEMK